MNEIIHDSTKQNFVKKITMALNVVLNNPENVKQKENITKQLTKIEMQRERLIKLFMDCNLNEKDFNLTNQELNKQEEDLVVKLRHIEDKEIIIKDKQEKAEKFFEYVSKNKDIAKFNKKLVDDYLVKIEKHSEELYIYLTLLEHPVIKNVPKRVSDRENIPIWDMCATYIINKGAVVYPKNIKVNVFLIA